MGLAVRQQNVNGTRCGNVAGEQDGVRRSLRNRAKRMRFHERLAVPPLACDWVLVANSVAQLGPAIGREQDFARIVREGLDIFPDAKLLIAFRDHRLRGNGHGQNDEADETDELKTWLHSKTGLNLFQLLLVFLAIVTSRS